MRKEIIKTLLSAMIANNKITKKRGSQSKIYDRQPLYIIIKQTIYGMNADGVGISPATPNWIAVNPAVVLSRYHVKFDGL